MKKRKIKILFILSLLAILLIGCKKEKTKDIKIEDEANVNIEKNIIEEVDKENKTEEIEKSSYEYIKTALNKDEKIYTNEEEVILKINNLGYDYVLITGFYELKKLEEDDWIDIPVGIEFSQVYSELDYLYEQIIRTSNLTDGKYKVLKELKVYDKYDRRIHLLDLVLEEEFTINNK